MKKIIISMIAILSLTSCILLPDGNYDYNPSYYSYETVNHYNLNYKTLRSYYSTLYKGKRFRFGGDNGVLNMRNINIYNNRMYIDFRMTDINRGYDKFDFTISTDIVYDGQYLHLKNVNVDSIDVPRFVDEYRLSLILNQSLENFIIADISNDGYMSGYDISRVVNIYLNKNNMVGIIKN